LDDDLLSFIQGSISSIWALEVLLLLRRDAAQAWRVDELARELRATDKLVSDQLVGLGSAGLVDCSDRCRYAPASPMLDELCARLHAAYRERPAQVIRAIMARPNDKLQLFADAFRFKGDRT
jgi:hypothetical protein